ncbi:MAG: universal stress protein [Candidatus Obscuribacterales bacterium]|nr:universal stress protein [Candidatus Obscuribacterales bacterium]
MKIVAAIDGTKHSRIACDAILGVKWPEDTEIKLLTVLKADETVMPFAAINAAARSNKAADEMLHAADSGLKQMETELQQLSGCHVYHEVAQGDAKSAIVETAKSWNADLIVMGSRGNKGMELFLLGSVSQGVLMQSPCPVIIVKSNSDTEKSLQKGFKKILLAVDNSPYSQAAMGWIKSMRWDENSQFKIMTVVAPLSEAFVDEQNASRSSALMIEHDAIIDLAKSDLQVQSNDLSNKVGTGKVTFDVGEGDPREVILQKAESWGADLIVMGSHGRTGLSKLLMGSVSQAVAVHSPCSVAIVRGLVPKGQNMPMQATGRFKLPSKEELQRKPEQK